MLTAVANNEGVVCFSVITMLWFAFYLFMFKQRQRVLSQVWGTKLWKDSVAELLPKYIKTVTISERTKKQRLNTFGLLENYISFMDRVPSYTIATGFIIVILSATTFLLLVITVYNFTLHVALKQSQAFYKEYASELASAITATCSAIAIHIMSLFYTWLAQKLTDNENHRTQRGYETHLTFKLYIFEFINYYGTLFYIAFVKPYFGRQ